GGDYRNALGRPESFKVTVRKEGGKQLPQPDAGPNFGGLMGPQKIPAQGAYVFKLFLPHWVAFEETGIYSITAARTLKVGRYNPQEWDKQKTTDLHAQAVTKIEVVRQNKKEMGEIIAALGNTMLGRQYEATETAESAAYELAYIQDERVIPYFAEAF